MEEQHQLAMGGLTRFMEQRKRDEQALREKEEKDRKDKEEKDRKDKEDQEKAVQEEKDRLVLEKAEKDRARVFALAAACGAYDRRQDREDRFSDSGSTPVKRKKSASRKPELQIYFEEHEAKMKRAIAGVPDPADVIVSHLTGNFGLSLVYILYVC